MKSQLTGLFFYERSVQYYETDVMGVVHHSNYLRLFEEARVEWIRHQGLAEFHFPNQDCHWAVLDTRTRHLLSATFGDVLQTFVRAKRQGLKIIFQYATFSKNSDKPIALGETILVPVSGEKKVIRLPKGVIDVLERQKWTETWL